MQVSGASGGLDSDVLASNVNIQNLFMQAPAMICIMEGRAGKCILSNPMFSKLFGGRDLIGKTPREVAPELEGQGYFEMLESVFDTGQAVYRYGYPGFADWDDDGNISQKFFNFTYSPYVLDGKRAGVMIFGVDVTQQVEATQRIEESEKKFQELANSIPQIVWTAKPDGRIDYFNKQWYEFSGYSEGSTENWLSILHPDDARYCEQVWKESVDTGKPYQVEYRFRDHVRGGYRWFLGRAVPVKNERKEIIKWLGTSTDIDDSKKENQRLEREVKERTIDLQKVNEELKRSNDELEQFAFVASHDLKAPLRKISTYTTSIQAKYGNGIDEAVRKQLDKITDSAQDMRELIESLLDFAKLNAKDLVISKINLQELFDDILNDIEIQVKEAAAEIKFNLAIKNIQGEENQLKRLFTNLIINALKFRKRESVTTVHISSEPAAKELISSLKLIPEKKYYCIHIQDNGIGIEAEYAQLIFEPFKRLHNSSAYEGTGLGLAICRRIAENHKGALEVQSGKGEGSTFTLVIPDEQ